jgi:hypothetical protein
MPAPQTAMGLRRRHTADRALHGMATGVAARGKERGQGRIRREGQLLARLFSVQIFLHESCQILPEGSHLPPIQWALPPLIGWQGELRCR